MTAAPASPRSLRGLAGLLSAQAAAWTGTRLLWIALPWFVLSTTGSAAKTGMVAFAQMLPYVVSQVLAGPLIDRIGPRRVSVVCDLVALGAMAAAPLLHSAGLLPLGALMALMGLVGAADGPSNAAKGVFVPSATRAARMPLERGTGLTGAVERSAKTVGPAIAGLVVAAFGGIYALWVVAALFAIAAVVVATLSDPVPEPQEAAVEPVGGYFAQLRQGVSFLRNEGLLRAIVGMVAVTNLLDQAFLAVLLPVWAKASGYGPEVVGLIVSATGVTAILASLAAAGFGHRLPRRAVYLVGFVIGGVPRFVALALGAPLWGVLAVAAVGGLGSGFINPILGAIEYERIPAALLGRVRTLILALSWSGIPFGGLVAGGLVTLVGLPGALWIVSGCYLAAVVLPGMRKEWSHMRRSTDETREPAGAP